MTIESIVNKFSPQTVESWLELMPNELEHDFVGLWQIIPQGVRGFGLSGPNLEQFTRRALNSLLDRGAIPMKGPTFSPDLRYGNRREEIVDNIVRVWLGEHSKEAGVDDVWFGLPETAQSP
jgi:hypothetical protein